MILVSHFEVRTCRCIISKPMFVIDTTCQFLPGSPLRLVTTNVAASNCETYANPVIFVVSLFGDRGKHDRFKKQVVLKFTAIHRNIKVSNILIWHRDCWLYQCIWMQSMHRRKAASYHRCEWLSYCGVRAVCLVVHPTGACLRYFKEDILKPANQCFWWGSEWSNRDINDVVFMRSDGAIEAIVMLMQWCSDELSTCQWMHRQHTLRIRLDQGCSVWIWSSNWS